MDDHISLTEAAQRLGLNVRTLYNKLSNGEGAELRAFKLYGRWRVPVEAVTEIVENARRIAEWRRAAATKVHRTPVLRGRYRACAPYRGPKLRPIALLVVEKLNAIQAA